MANTLTIGADNLITIDKLMVPDSNPPDYVDNATITWDLKNGSGVSQGTGSYTYTIGSNGQYQTVIGSAITALLTANQKYTLESSVTATDFISLFKDYYYAVDPKSLQYTYAVRSDLENIYGKKNVARWADIDNDGVLTTIDARINWALELSYDYVNNKLDGGMYAVPLAGRYPMIVTCQAHLASVYLYESRGLTNKSEDGKPIHQLEQGRDWAINVLAQIRAGVIRIQRALPQDVVGTIVPMPIRTIQRHPYSNGYGWSSVGLW